MPAPAVSTASTSLATASGTMTAPLVTRRPFQRPEVRTPLGERFPRSGRWGLYLTGGIMILIALGVLTVALVVLPDFGTTRGIVPAASQPPISASLAPPATSAHIVILEPENGARIEGTTVTFRGTGPAGAELIHDVPSGTDTVAPVGADGSWVLAVPLQPGTNEVTLRLGDDPATEMTWTVTSVGPLSSAPAEISFEPITLRASGSRIVPFEIPDEAIAIATIRYRGGGSFAVSTLDENDQATDQLVTASGNYDGTRLIDADHRAVAIRVEATGPWTVLIRPVSAAQRWDGSGTLSGTGSNVFVIDPPAAAFRSATIRHTGAGTFSVVGYSPAGREDHANTVGTYFGESLLREGTTILAIEAGGRWSIVLD
jgi:hypothetical protein